MSNTEPRHISKHASFIIIDFFLELQSPVEIAFPGAEQPRNSFLLHGIVLRINNLRIPLKQHVDILLNIRLHNTENGDHIFIQIKLFSGFVCELVGICSLWDSRIRFSLDIAILRQPTAMAWCGD